MTLRRTLWLAAALAIAGLYFLVDPGNTPWMPQCLFHKFTGFLCPGCGSQRMAHALLQGDIAAAWRFNAFALLLLPFLAFAAILEANRKRWNTLYRKVFHPAVAWTLLALIILWWLLRNILPIS